MSKFSKALLGWFLICVVIGFVDSFSAGLGSFVVGIGIFLIGYAIADWVGEIEAKDRMRDKEL